jgi:hypothetical protein
MFFEFRVVKTATKEMFVSYETCNAETKTNIYHVNCPIGLNAKEHLLELGWLIGMNLMSGAVCKGENAKISYDDIEFLYD